MVGNLRIEGWFCYGDQTWVRNCNLLKSGFYFFLDHKSVFLSFCFDRICYLWKSDMLSDFRSNLCCITINCLFSTEDDVEFSF